MSTLPYTLDPAPKKRLGLIVLQADETIETEFRSLLPPELPMQVSRVPSGQTLTPETIGEMEERLTEATARLPSHAGVPGVHLGFDCTAYACTSATAQIGAARVHELIHQGTLTQAAADPVTALIAACRIMGIGRLGVLSPYVPQVGARLLQVLGEAGIATPATATFNEQYEAHVARISGASLIDAGRQVAAMAGIDALFLSCTNLRTLTVIPRLEALTGLPVLSSNQVLAWYMLGMVSSSRDMPWRNVPGRLATFPPTPLPDSW